MIRESTKQGNDKVARNMESAHRARLANQSKEEDAACERLGCSEVEICHECEKLFNADKAVRKEQHVFCCAEVRRAMGQGAVYADVEGLLR